MKRSMLDISIGSDSGRVKLVNEDRGYFQQAFDSEGTLVALCAVADGMGGLEAGELASEIAIQYLNQWWEERVKVRMRSNITMELDAHTSPLMLQSTPLKSLAQELDQVFSQINDAIILQGRQLGKKMGTTLSVFFLYGQEYVINHIGDSRIYRLTKHAELLTEDHSWVALQVKKGQLTLEEARHHPSRHILTQCLGVNDRICPFIRYGSLQRDDIILICSDGFYTMVDESQWFNHLKQARLKSRDLQTTLDELILLANQNGGHDNITIIIVNGINDYKSYVSKIIDWFIK